MGFQGDEEKGKGSPEIPIKPSLFRYNSPLTQVSLIGLVCFCCPGMFNALSGMGGGGQVDPTAANNANIALYTTFAVFGILGGGIYNILGPKLTLLTACSTYVLYAGSFLYYNHYHHQAFAIVAGAILGIGAGLLWAAQGAIMTSYPPHDRKGTYIALFWSIFNMGGVIGGLIPFALNYHRTSAVSVNDGTYIGSREVEIGRWRWWREVAMFRWLLGPNRINWLFYAIFIPVVLVPYDMFSLQFWYQTQFFYKVNVNLPLMQCIMFN
ncbi:hypothetical protein ACJIZ3_019829 [Penstemon smallii]|uniref:Uncharacterized protein n=1 Tax=Penstemon smallii TaxID=265156 RepID=A0ABD3T2E9_9LAMI